MEEREEAKEAGGEGEGGHSHLHKTFLASADDRGVIQAPAHTLY